MSRADSRKKTQDPVLWKEVQDRFGFTEEDIRKAQYLGFKPAALLRLEVRPQERWKLPPGKWVNSLYRKRQEKEEKRRRAKEKWKRKTKTFIPAIILMMGIMAARSEAAAAVFSDVPQDAGWAKSVYWAAGNDYVRGFADGTYRPQDNLTREQFVIILWRMNGREESEEGVAFSDVDRLQPGCRALRWAVREGIISGYGDNTFRPAVPVTREQVAVIIWRLAGRPAAEEGADFPDVDRSASTYRAVSWGQEVGIIKGFEDGSFHPEEYCSRAQIVTMFYRYKRNIEGDDVSVEITEERGEIGTESASGHVHIWKPVYKIVHHDAEYRDCPVYGTLHHDAVTQEKDITEYHTVCDVCGMRLDDLNDRDFNSHIEAHIIAGEGSGYGTASVVTGQETVIVKEAYDETIQIGTETVMVQSPWDETVIEGYKCTECGAEK